MQIFVSHLTLLALLYFCLPAQSLMEKVKTGLNNLVLIWSHWVT